jgi:hypothetical protein
MITDPTIVQHKARTVRSIPVWSFLLCFFSILVKKTFSNVLFSFLHKQKEILYLMEEFVSPLVFGAYKACAAGRVHSLSKAGANLERVKALRAARDKSRLSAPLVKAALALTWWLRDVKDFQFHVQVACEYFHSDPAVLQHLVGYMRKGRQQEDDGLPDTHISLHDNEPLSLTSGVAWEFTAAVLQGVIRLPFAALIEFVQFSKDEHDVNPFRRNDEAAAWALMLLEHHAWSSDLVRVFTEYFSTKYFAECGARKLPGLEFFTRVALRVEVDGWRGILHCIRLAMGMTESHTSSTLHYCSSFGVKLPCHKRTTEEFQVLWDVVAKAWVPGMVPLLLRIVLETRNASFRC